MTQWINESVSYECVYRTVPATPGLLNIKSCVNSKQMGFFQTWDGEEGILPQVSKQALFNICWTIYTANSELNSAHYDEIISWLEFVQPNVNSLGRFPACSCYCLFLKKCLTKQIVFFNTYFIILPYSLVYSVNKFGYHLLL